MSWGFRAPGAPHPSYETRLINIFLHHGVDSVERESFATVEKGKSKVNFVFGKRRARAFGKRRCKM
ncbi:unnamed protein product [Prunus armeniaca]|uniref:Uncharacterized protein n=1 Tax=Prunus armeniaca TaxID=36596 RepID=A0A6J5TGN5_PRUAR|nr:unnamed protein product [Prunus armeniaca]